jgi:protein-S-isoprenylcysteine O-methyltransferase Ste14
MGVIVDRAQGDDRFWLWVLLISLGLSAVRAVYGGRARVMRSDIIDRRANLVRMTLIWAFGLLGTFSSALYVLAPSRIAAWRMALPVSLRLAGVGLGAATVSLFWWTHHALGTNWAMPAITRTDQLLVIHEPYRWVRHPMYTSIGIWALAYWLMTANGLVGFGWAGMAGIAASLVPAEERGLEQRFGDAYRAYRARTGRFLPRISKSNANL